jgi:hypothetical protein
VGGGGFSPRDRSTDKEGPAMRDPLMPINAQEDPKSGPPDGAEKQALCISVATLILSVRASTSHRATSLLPVRL